MELSKDHLPTNSDIIRHAKYITGNILHEVSYENQKSVAEAVISVWRTVSDVFCEPVTSKDASIIQKVGRVLQRAYDCEAGLAKKKEKQTCLSNSEKIFSILHCDCDILSCAEFGCKSCSKQVHLSSKCKHSAETRIPEPLLIFLRYLASCIPFKQAYIRF